MTKKRALPTMPLALLLLATTLPALGCRTLGPRLRGLVHPAAAEFQAVVAAPPLELLSTLADAASQGDPRVRALLEGARLLGLEDPIGVALVVMVKGENQPRLIRCVGDFEAKCRALEPQAVVHISAVLEGATWRPISLRTRD